MQTNEVSLKNFTLFFALAFANNRYVAEQRVAATIMAMSRQVCSIISTKGGAVFMQLVTDTSACSASLLHVRETCLPRMWRMP